MPSEEAVLDKILNLEIASLYLLEGTLTHLGESWDRFSADFNPGQYEIYYYYLADAIGAWMENAAEDWPWVDAYEYVDEVYSAYDVDVIDRAFSNAVFTPVDMMEQNIERAQALSYLMEALDALLF